MPTGYEIDDVVFTVTRTGTSEAEISGSVTMTQDDAYLHAESLELDVFTIPANETTVSHTLSEVGFHRRGDADSGDLTATLDAMATTLR